MCCILLWSGIQVGPFSDFASVTPFVNFSATAASSPLMVSPNDSFNGCTKMGSPIYCKITKLHHESLLRGHVGHTIVHPVALSSSTRVSLAGHSLMMQPQGISWAASDVPPSFARPWSEIIFTGDHGIYLHQTHYLCIVWPDACFQLSPWTSYPSDPFIKATNTYAVSLVDFLFMFYVCLKEFVSTLWMSPDNGKGSVSHPLCDAWATNTLNCLCCPGFGRLCTG